MKPKFFILVILSVFAFFNLSWATCPQDTVDLGFCDTLHVVPWDAISCDSFPCFVHVPLLITHDSNTFYWQGGSRWAQDSISCITVLLAWTRTNPTKYCSVSSFWNGTALLPSDPNYSRSVWRDFGGMQNRMSWLAQQAQNLEWDSGEIFTWPAIAPGISMAAVIPCASPLISGCPSSPLHPQIKDGGKERALC